MGCPVGGQFPRGAFRLRRALLTNVQPLVLRQGGKFASLYAQREGQATLIRPDGYVAARLCDRTSPNKVEGLFGVLRSVLGV
jgi:hypothetical protein